MSQPLYRRLLGPDFDVLPTKVRELHDVRGTVIWKGRAEVQRGTSLLARLIAVLACLPPTASDLPLTVTFTGDGEGETWRREFGTHVFLTHQRLGRGVILERIGLAEISLHPQSGPEGLSLTVTRMTTLGLSLPSWLVVVVRAREHEVGGRYAFDVEAGLPVLGRLVRYKGWLERAG